LAGFSCPIANLRLGVQRKFKKVINKLVRKEAPAELANGGLGDISPTGQLLAPAWQRVFCAFQVVAQLNSQTFFCLVASGIAKFPCKSTLPACAYPLVRK
jgi:hypothetical protein